jgi:hypothetical protein
MEWSEKGFLNEVEVLNLEYSEQLARPELWTILSKLPKLKWNKCILPKGQKIEHDVTFIIKTFDKEREFPSHKLMFAKASEYFRAMFVSWKEENAQQIILEECTEECFEEIYKFIYEREKFAIENYPIIQTFDLLVTAQRFLVTELKQKCVERLIQSLEKQKSEWSLDSAQSILNFAFETNEDQLKLHFTSFFLHIALKSPNPKEKYPAMQILKKSIPDKEYLFTVLRSFPKVYYGEMQKFNELYPATDNTSLKESERKESKDEG